MKKGFLLVVGVFALTSFGSAVGIYKKPVREQKFNTIASQEKLFRDLGICKRLEIKKGVNGKAQVRCYEKNKYISKNEKGGIDMGPCYITINAAVETHINRKPFIYLADSNSCGTHINYWGDTFVKYGSKIQRYRSGADSMRSFWVGNKLYIIEHYTETDGFSYDTISICPATQIITGKGKCYSIDPANGKYQNQDLKILDAYTMGRKLFLRVKIGESNNDLNSREVKIVKTYEFNIR